MAKVGETLTAKVTPEKATVTYKWMRADAEDGEYVAIAGATDKTYTLSEADAGKWIKVEVKGTGNYTGTKSKVVGPVEEVEEPIETIEAIIDYNAVWNESRGTWYIKVTVPDENLDAGSVKSIHAITEAGVDLDEPRELTPDTDTVMWFGVAKADGEVTLKADGEYAYKVVRLDDSEYIFNFTYASSEVQGEINLVQAALQAVNDAGTTAAMQAAIEDNAAVLGLDMESYNELIEARQPSVSVDLVANKGEGYTLDSLKKTFNAIVATRHATQASMDKVNNAESIADLDGISWVTELLAQFKSADEVYDYHSGIALSEKISALEGLVTRYNDLPEANQAAVLVAVWNNGEDYSRSQATTDALAAAIADQESIVGEVTAALDAVNEATTTATMQTAIEANAEVLGLDMTSYNALLEARRPAVSVDLVANKPAGGYDQATLTKYFDAIVATRHATQASMDKVNNAESIADLEGISWVTELLAQFKSADEVYDYHSGIALSEKISALEGLVTRYNDLPEANQAAVLVAVWNNGEDYSRSQATTDALAAAIADQESIVGEVTAALDAVNEATTTATMQTAIEANAEVLGLDMTSYNALLEARRPAVSVDLVANKPAGGYDQATLTKYFDAIVATRHATQASMDKVNNAESIADLEGISWVTELLAQFKSADEVYDYHSGIALSEKISALEGLVTRYNDLPEANQAAVLVAVWNNGEDYSRSQATTDALAAAIADQESIVGEVTAALDAVNEATTTATMQTAIEANAEVLGLDMTSYNALLEARRPAVSVDLVANKPAGGYDQATLTKYFDAIVATRHATQASMDKVNNAESIADLEGISWVTELLAQFKSADEVYDYHSGIALSEKISALEGLVTRYNDLPEANQAAVLVAVWNNGEDYSRSQATTDALAAAIADQESIVGEVTAALDAVNEATTTATMQTAIEANAEVLGLDMTSYNALLEARRPAVSVDLVANKPAGGYDQATLTKYFDAIVATRHATQASMDKVNNAESIADLEGISWVTELLAQFKSADEVYDYHSGIALSEKISALEGLVTRYNDLPEANQAAVLVAVWNNGEDYSRSQATTDALAAAIADQESIVGEVTAALDAVNEATTTATMQTAIEANAEVLGLDMTSYNALLEARRPAVSVDLVANKPAGGYDQATLTKYFDAIVATRHATQASMDKVNNAESIADLEGISWVTELLAQFKSADEVYDYHSGIALSEKISALEGLVTRYNDLPEANQAAVLVAVWNNGEDYSRSQATTDALAAAIADQESIVGEVTAALDAVNEATTTATMQTAIEANAEVLGLDMTSYNALLEARRPAVSVDLVANKPAGGYDQATLTKYFDAIVATRHATQASMDKVNNAESIADLEGISWVTELLAQFKSADEVYDYHSGIALSEKISALEGLVTRYNDLPEANQAAVLVAVWNNGEDYSRSQATTDALAAAIADQESIVGEVTAALDAVNEATTTATMQTAIEANAEVLGLDMTSYNALLEARRPAVSVDLVANKPAGGYDQATLTKYFDAIVATRHATQASMDKVNNAESIADLEGISWVTELLAQFKSADEVYDYHSGIALSEKISALEGLVTRYNDLPEANQAAVLVAVWNNGEDYSRSQATTDALAAAIADQESIVGEVTAALDAVNEATTTATMQTAIEANAEVLGLDMTSYNALLEARRPAVSVDLVANKPAGGYDQATLTKYFDAIVATRHATQASMDKVNNAESIADLEGISWVTELLAQFKSADEVYDYHSGIALSEKISALEGLVTRYNDLPEANQAAVLVAVWNNGEDYSRSQATTDALAAAIADQESIVGEVTAALDAVNEATTTATMQTAIEANAEVLGLDMTSYNALLEARRPAVSVDLVANKPAGGYDQATLTKYFDAIVATRHATQASMDKVNNAESIADLEGISWVTELLAQFKSADEVYDYHSGIALSEKISALEGLVTRYNDLPEANQAAVLVAVWNNGEDYSRSQATTDALAAAIADQESIVGEVTAALDAVNEATTTATMQTAIEANAEVLGLDMTSYNALLEARRPAVSVDLVANKPAGGYDQATLTKYFDAIVATRHATQASMDKVNNAESIADLEGISWVTELLAQFKSADEVYDYHSGIALSEKISALEGLVTRYNDLPEANQAAVLVAVWNNGEDYSRSQATTDALAAAIADQESIVGEVTAALDAVNEATTTATMQTAIEANAEVLGLDMTSYNALLEARRPAVSVDLVANKPAGGYDQATLTKYFDAIVATRHATQASMDKVNNAESIADLEGISWVTELLAQFKSADEVYDYHSGIALSEKISALEGLVTRYNDLPEANQAAVLVAVWNNGEDYSRSQATTDALAAAIADQESIVGEVTAALDAVNEATTTATMQTAIEANAEVLGLDMTSYNALLEARRPAVSVDLVANKPAGGYDQATLTKYFDAIVATRHATQASMDKVNNAESIADLEGISWVTELLAQFKSADEVYDYHSGIALSEKISALEGLVTRYNDLPEANQAAVLVAVWNNGEDYSRSQATTDALAAAIADQESIVGEVTAALDAVNEATTTATMQTAIEANAEVLGLDMTSYNALLEARRPAVSVDLVANKPAGGYDQATLTKYFDAIVATRHATQASMDKVNNAESIADLEGISWVTELLAQFKSADEVYDYHSGIALSEKISALEGLVTRYNDLPEANQAAVLVAVWNNGEDYSRSQATTDALAAAIADQESIVGEVTAALDAVNEATTTATMQTAIEANAEVLGLDMTSYNALLEARRPAVSVDLVANKPAGGYDQATLTKYFDAIVATRHATQASMDKVNNAESIADLEGISWVTELLAQFKSADEVYDYHSGIALSEKISALEGLVTRYNDLPEANQAAVLVAVWNNGEDYSRSQATTDALAAAIADQESIVGEVTAALDAVNEATTTATMQTAIEANAEVLGLDMTSYNALLEARRPAVSVDLVANKPAGGYDQATLTKYFDAIVATRHATQASMDKVNNAESIADLEGISWVTELLAQFKSADEVYDYHSGIALSEKISALEGLVTRYNDLPEANQAAVLVAVWNNGEDYSRSQATTDALAAAIADQESIVGEVTAALDAVNEATTTATMQTAIEANAEVLGLDMTSYNALLEARRPAVSVDLVANKPAGGYDQATLTKYFDAIVATRHATQASMDKVNNAESIADLEGISWVTELLAQFKSADEVYDYHSGIALSEKISALEGLVTRYNDLPEANQAAVLVAVWNNGEDYSRSQATTDALAAAIADQESIVGEVTAALDAVNEATTTATMQTAIEANAEVLGLDMTSYNALLEARRPAVSVDLVANKPAGGYDQATLTKYFDAIVATRHATQASMDKVNNAESIADLEGISWVTELLAQFKSADEVYDYHSGIALSEKISALEGLVTRYNDLPEANQAAVLVAVWNNGEDYSRSQATTDALAAAIADQESIVGEVTAALDAVNEATTTATMQTAIEANAEVLGLDMTSYNALLEARRPAVSVDLVANKPAGGYDQATLTKYFDAIVATRHATQASMDKVNNAESIADLEGISWVTELLAQFKSADEVYDYHSGIALSEKISALEGLVTRYNDLPEANQAAVLVAVWNNGEDYSRSQATTDALAAAIADQESIVGEVTAALDAVNEATTTATMQTAIEANAEVLGLDMTSYNALLEARRPAVSVDLVANKPAGGYDQATLTKYFDAIVATRHATQASMDKVNNAESIADLEGISWVTELLAQFKSADEVYDYHSGIALSEKISALEGLVTRYNDLPEANQAAVLVAVWNNGEDYSRSQATTDALAAAIADQESIVGEVTAALDAVNEATTTATMQTAIEANAEVLGLDMTSYNALLEARRPAVSVDLVANKPAGGYDQATLTKYFDAIVATRHATQASMDKVNNAESIADLEGISWVTELLAQFKSADEVYDYHSGIALSEKISALEGLVTRYNDLPEANQAAVLVAVWNNGEDYSRSQATTDALAAAIADQESIVGEVTAALDAVNEATTTATMQTAIEANAEVLGLDMTSYNALLEARRPAVSVDLVANKPAGGYDQATLTKYFDAIVATRHATQASMDKVNNAESIADLEGISWVTELLAQFKSADEVYDYHSGIALSEKISALEGLVTRYNDLPEANQAAVLVAVWNNGEDYSRSQATTDALAAAIADQESIVGEVTAALDAVNEATTTATMQTAIEANAEVLGLDMTSYNALLEARRPAVSVDLVANKPAGGYDQATLTKYFDAIVATRHATQASMDKVNNAESIADLEGISWVTELLAQFKSADEVYDYHSGIALSEKISALEGLVTRYNDLPEANQAAVLVAVWNNGEDYSRSQATTDALAAAIADQESIVGEVTAALDAVNEATTTATMQTAIEANAEVLGLDMTSYNALLEARRPAVSVDLVANKPAGGYDQATLTKYFDAIVATRHATQASMDKVNNAESIADLEGISWVTELLAQFKSADEVYDYHSGIALSEKISALEGLVTRYNDLPEANQAAVLVAVWNNGEDYSRSQATTDALAAAIADQESIVGEVTAALDAVNEATTTATMQTAIEANAEVLGLDMTSYNALLEARRPAVSVDLVANKPAGGYDQATLTKYFDAIVATRHATQASMDKVNNAESIADLEGISWVTELLAQFKSADEVYDYHSGIALSEKISALEGLVTRYNDLPEANQAAVLVAVWNNGEDYSRSQATTDALAAAIADQESIVGEVTAALDAVNEATTTATMQTAIEANAEVLGLDMTSYNALLEARRPAVSVDLVANKPAGGYDQATLTKYFDAIVATRHATQASMDKVNNAESIADLEGISWVTELLAQFKSADEVYDYHSGIALSEKISALEGLVTRYNDLPEANQAAVLVAVWNNGEDYSRSQATTDALAAAIADQESIVGEVTAALDAVNEATTTATMQTAIEANAEVLGLDMTSYNALLEARRPAVSVDLVANKPAGGYDQATLTKYFDAIVATRHATQASMDKVNNAESIADLEGISWVTALLTQFEAADEVYDYHSGIALSEKISTLQDLVERYNSLDEAGKAAVLQKLLDKRPEDGYARSQATTDALAEALTEVEAEPFASTYKFSYEVPEEVIAGESYTVPVKIEPETVGDVGYERVRFDVEVTTPEGATVHLLANDTNGVVHDVAQIGYWGPEYGFPISADYSETTEFTAIFSDAGEYTITFSLVDLDAGEALVTETVTIEVIGAVGPVEALITDLPEVPDDPAPELPDFSKPKPDGEKLTAIYNYLAYLENAEAVAAAKEAFDALDPSDQAKVELGTKAKLDAAVAKISELKAFVIDNTTIGVGTYKEDYSGLTEGAKGRIMVSVQWPFRVADGFNTEEGLTSIEEYLYNDERGELVRNVAVLDKMNPSTTGNWPCNLSGSFDLGVQRISSSGSWNNGLYELSGDEVTQADLPDKVVVEFTYKGVLFVIEEEVELTPEMFIAEPSPEDFGYTFDAATKTITGYNGDEAALVIPSSFKVDGVNVPVEIIKEYAFSNNTTLTSVEMPDTLKTIYRNAFAGCTNLESVHLGNNVSTISTYAFDGCTSLKSIAIPNSVTSLGTYAFRGCSNLETITIGSGLTTITNNVFEGCSKLNNVTIPSNITLLGKDTFKDCVGLTDLTIEGNVRGTNGGAFSGCSNLTTVTIGNSVTSIGNYLFQNHSALTSIIIPVGVTEFGQFAFSGTGLTSIEIPSSVTTLGNYVFQNCNKLGSIAIPDTVTSLGTYAFAGCTELSDITIGSGLTTIKDNTFARCPSLVSMVIPDNITSIGYSAFIGTYESGAFTGENLDKIIIGADVMIAGDVFGTTPRNTFEETYAANDKAAGTYIFADGSWSKEGEVSTSEQLGYTFDASSNAITGYTDKELTTHGEDEEELDELDITFLEDVIKEAIAAKEGIVISEDGSDVPVGTYWVTQDDMDALDAAIAAAEVAKGTVEIQQDVDNAVAELEAVIATFNDTKQEAIHEEEIEEPAEDERLAESEESVEDEEPLDGEEAEE